MPDLRQLRYFTAVAETLNFRQAAEQLHVAQPALSAAIKQLETELGVQLLERTTRSVSLTATGEIFLERARRTLEVAEDAFSVGRDTAAGIAGQVRLGTTPIARTHVVPRLLDAWMDARPGIAVHMTEAATGPLLTAVAAGEIDLAIAWCPLEQPGLRYERLRDEPVCAQVATDHSLAVGGSVSLSRLAQEPILVGSGEASRGFTEAIIDLFAGEGLEPPTLADPYPDLGLLAAIEGRAVFIGSAAYAQKPRSDLVVLDIDPPRTLPIVLVWRDREPPATVAALLGLARSVRDADGWVAD